MNIPDNSSLVQTAIEHESHIAQYMQFKESCLNIGVAPSEILSLWHTYQLSRGVSVLRELTCAVDNTCPETDEIFSILHRIATAIECR